MKERHKSAYSEYISTNSSASIYHTLQWHEVIKEVYEYKPLYLLALESGKIVGALPMFLVETLIGGRRLVSLPFSHMVMPLADRDEVLSALLVEAKDMLEQSGAEYLEIKSSFEHDPKGYVQRSKFWRTELILDRPEDQLFKGFDSGVRRAIRKAENSNVRVEKLSFTSALDDFYGLMLETRRRQGSPVYSRHFFDVLARQFDVTGNVAFYGAYLNSSLISGLIMLFHGEVALYAYGASTSSKELMAFRPNNLLFWYAIKEAKVSGYHYFDFGVTHIDNESLLRFKNGWGGVSNRLFYSYCLSEGKIMPKMSRAGFMFEITSGAFKKMPLWLSRRLGPVVIRQFG